MGLGIISHSMHPCESGGVCVLIDRSDKRNRLLHARSVFKEKLNGCCPISHIFTMESNGRLEDFYMKSLAKNLVLWRIWSSKGCRTG